MQKQLLSNLKDREGHGFRLSLSKCFMPNLSLEECRMLVQPNHMTLRNEGRRRADELLFLTSLLTPASTFSLVGNRARLKWPWSSLSHHLLWTFESFLLKKCYWIIAGKQCQISSPAKHANTNKLKLRIKKNNKCFRFTQKKPSWHLHISPRLLFLWASPMSCIVLKFTPTLLPSSWNNTTRHWLAHRISFCTTPLCPVLRQLVLWLWRTRGRWLVPSHARTTAVAPNQLKPGQAGFGCWLVLLRELKKTGHGWRCHS